MLTDVPDSFTNVQSSPASWVSVLHGRTEQQQKFVTERFYQRIYFTRCSGIAANGGNGGIYNIEK